MSLLLSQLSGSATLTADAGAFSLSGQSATFAVTLTVAPGAFSLAGVDDLFNSALVTAPGSYALAGIDSAFAITLPATTGAFDVAGISAEFSVGGEQPADVVAPAGGSFSRQRWRELAHRQPQARERPAARQEIRLHAKGGRCGVTMQPACFDLRQDGTGAVFLQRNGQSAFGMISRMRSEHFEVDHGFTWLRQDESIFAMSGIELETLEDMLSGGIQ